MKAEKASSPAPMVSAGARGGDQLGEQISSPNSTAINSRRDQMLDDVLANRVGWTGPRPALSREAAEEYHRQRGDQVLIVEPGSTRRFIRPAPQVTLEAIVWAVRERGLSALDKPTNQDRLQTLSLEQRGEVQARIERLAAAGKIPC